MKLTTKLCGAALLAAMGVAVVAPKATVTKAAPDSNSGLGEIEFVTATYGSFDTTGGVVPPNSSDTTKDTEAPLKDGEFVVQGMSKLDFGQHEAVAGAVEAWAKPTTANPSGSADKVEGRGNWVQIKDNRTTDDHTYNLGAKITDDFKATVNGTERKLTGAQITYANPILVADKENESLKPQSPTLTQNAVVSADSVTTIFSNTEKGKGRGRYAVYFGEKGNTAKPADQSVKLNIPSDQAQEIQKAKYTATITWTLSETPL